MPGVEEAAAAAPVLATPEYSVLKQRVDLDLSFSHRSLKGSTEITLQPLVKDLQQIRLHCRQCKPTTIQAGGITAKFEYDDPYLRVHRPRNSTVHQHEMLKHKIERSLRPSPSPELIITVPPKLKIQELAIDPVTALPAYNSTPSVQKQEADAMAVLETPTAANMSQQGPQFAPIMLYIEFETSDFIDGLHWVGFEESDKRFPYCYTKADHFPGTTSSVFPCIDDATSKCAWEIAIKCSKTLGDAFRKPIVPDTNSGPHQAQKDSDGDLEMTNGTAPSGTIRPPEAKYTIDLSDSDSELDLVVVCIGEQVDDVPDPDDESRHTVTFSLGEPVTARHVGFAIGPFEHVDLSASREAEEEERLGQNAIKVGAYCLPGRSEEVRIPCLPLTKALDYFGVNYGSFPFNDYQMLFVDDLVYSTISVAGLSICSSRLLFPYEIIEPLEENTRILVRALTEQWMGVYVVAQERSDAWVVAGVAGFMADLFGKVIFGNNSYRWQQKLAAEKVYELDVDRPSIYQHGPLLHLDASLREFLNLKSALVLFILDRRLMKANGSSGVTRIINRIFLQAKTGQLVNGELSTADFQRTCEKLGHNKLESFFKQWVLSAGCPIFFVTQRFNKKKLVVEMSIVQKQLERVTKPQFEPSIFMREIKEHVQEVWAPEVQPVFTGPMTIRIHEADGTPYEHTVEIKEATTKLEIPYNTKYKRLKRSRRQKERALAEGTQGEGGEDSLLYCLGDILDSPEEVRDWNLHEWTKEEEDKMGQESYEWIRIDADFEWIGKIHLVMPVYMYISQLQQDRDLVAQYESMRYVLGSNPHHVSLTILVRTLMDRRYFHGIRAMAAEGLAMLSREREKTLDIGQFHLEKAFEELFCFPGEIMPRPNDWSDRTNYIIQCAIPRAMAKLRDGQGKVPMPIRKFFVDKLKFNDNSDNEYSDCHYVATLMRCLAEALVVSHREPEPSYTFSFGDEEPVVEAEDLEAIFEKEAISEIERYRRIDEWVTTYQNTYSITALECLSKLSKAGLVKDKTKEVLQYTRQSNADLVRLGAFTCLKETGLTRRMPMMKYLLQSIADDHSPLFRNRLIKCLGEALGDIALGDREPEKSPAQTLPDAESGLILEQEVNTEDKHLEATRKTTPEGALVALKATLGNDETFKRALWRTTHSHPLTVDEVGGFCDIAALLFKPIACCLSIARLPRSYRCEKVGKASVRFIPYGPFRTRPRKGLALDDWELLQEHNLKYTGILSVEVRKAQKAVDEQPLKIQLSQMRQQAETVMQPPSAGATPTTEKTGIKLSLVSHKRKQTNDGSVSAGSPKAPKLSRQQTPSGQAPSPKNRQSPSNASHQRSSSSTLKASAPNKSLVVKLPFSTALTTHSKINNILSAPPKPTIIVKPSSTQATAEQKPSNQSNTSRSTSFSYPSGIPQSPSGNNFFASPQITSMNVGGFRSFGGSGALTDITSPFDVSQSELKRESVEVASPLSIPPPSASPPMPPPPKPMKKLTLKLGPRAGSLGGQDGSPS